MTECKGIKVFVGLSGGVDSSVTAALLKRTGAVVTGVFIKGWYPPGMSCTWRDDRRDAMRVAAHLGIPFLTLDASATYKKNVIDYLIEEYRKGRTPNPDIMCNRFIKFGVFHEFMKERGASAIATGHYARTIKDGKGDHLLRGVDEGKDQSYFLWAVERSVLNDALFPLGDLQKSHVRKLARRYQLPTAGKKDSQGICFLGSISVDEFLRAEIAPTSGKALSEEGAEVGAHDGAVLYTLGARIALNDALPGPWYVVKKDLEENTLTVAHMWRTATARQDLALSDCNWLQGDSPLGEVEAQYRYHGPRVQGMLSRDGKSFLLLKPLVEPIASGQSLVLYRDEECLGGGIIE